MISECQAWSLKDLEDLKCRQIRRLRCKSSLIGSIFLPQTNKTLDIWLFDLSKKGAGVTATESIEVGQEAIIKLNRTPAISLIPLHARVVHTTENESHFCIGCEFNEPIESTLWEYLVH